MAIMAWKDGFVIEYVDRAWKINCYKCDYCSSSGKVCIKKGVNLSRVANSEWKTCKYFELSTNYDTESMRMRVAQARAAAKGKKAPKKKKKQSEKGEKAKRQPIANSKQRKITKELDGVFETIGIGTKATSPIYGPGKVVGIEEDWVTVAFVKDSKRIRFDIEDALRNGKLVV